MFCQKKCENMKRLQNESASIQDIMLDRNSNILNVYIGMRGGCDRMVVRLTTTCAIGAYQH